MRAAALGLTVFLLVFALPALVRADANFHRGQAARAAIESGRFLLAIAAASLLIVLAVRGQ